MNKQSKALRLADALMDYYKCSDQDIDEAAAELRRLHAQRDSLLEALRMFVSCAIPVSTKIDERGYGWTQAYLDQALPKARAAIKAVEETK